MAFLLYISRMKKFMIIGIGLCLMASLDSVALSTHKRDKVPKNDECSLSEAALVNHFPSFEITPFMFSDAFIGSEVIFKNGGLTKSPEIGFAWINENEVIIPRFDFGEFAVRDYKSPHVDRSWIWKYSHFHSC